MIKANEDQVHFWGCLMPWFPRHCHFLSQMNSALKITSGNFVKQKLCLLAKIENFVTLEIGQC